MTEISDRIEREIFIKNKKSLFEVSLDDSDEKNPVNMVDIDRDISKDIVIDFDDVKTDFCRKFHKSNEVFKSADALFYSETKNKLIFVEFKNGKVRDVKTKLKDSLLVFSNIVDVDLKFCRKYLEYIVVYNYDKNKDNITQKKKEKENKQGVDEHYKEGIANKLYEFRNDKNDKNDKGDELILFGLDLMKDICVSNVHTYTVDEFVEYYSKNCTK